MRSKNIRYLNSQQEKLIIQPGKDFFENCKGRWRSQYFHNTNPIVLELACGRGEYTVGLSSIFPEKNFIGVDIKGERMMQGIKNYYLQNPSHQAEFPNIAFLRTIINNLVKFFNNGEVDDLRIVHPDPRPKGHDERRRLTSDRFLKLYASILKPGSLVRLQTDDKELFEYSLHQFTKFGWKLSSKTDDLYRSPLQQQHYNIVTRYEQEALKGGKKICYAVYQLPLSL